MDWKRSMLAVTAAFTLGFGGLGLAATPEVAAAPDGKMKICHFSEAVLDNPDTVDVNEAQDAKWVVITVSGNSSHVKNMEPSEAVTSEACLAQPTDGVTHPLDDLLIDDDPE